MAFFTMTLPVVALVSEFAGFGTLATAALSSGATYLATTTLVRTRASARMFRSLARLRSDVVGTWQKSSEVDFSVGVRLAIAKCQSARLRADDEFVLEGTEGHLRALPGRE